MKFLFFLNLFPLNCQGSVHLFASIPVNPTLLLQNDFTVQFNKLKKDTDLWRTLPLSLIGRVNKIQMVSLPRFMYLFQNIPINLPLSFKKNLTQ